MILVLILRLLFIWFIVRSLVRLVRGIMEGLQQPPSPKPPQAVPLVRDPICGTYVVPANALSTGSGAEMRFFCSENCRRAYASRERNGSSGEARRHDASPSDAPKRAGAQRRRRTPAPKTAQ